MSSAEKSDWISPEDYLEREETAQTKREYVDGWIRAMSGAKNRHNVVAVNTLVLLANQLKGKPCRSFNSDTKVRIRNGISTWFYYPDVMVVCEQNSLDDVYQDNPVLVVEVLSLSTRSIDLDEKLQNYLSIPSLQYFLLLEQALPRAILMRRSMKGFIREVYDGLDGKISLDAIGCTLPLGEIYAQIDFSPDAVRDEQLPYLVECAETVAEQ
jgi:Uma2 family endonuclease